MKTPEPEILDTEITEETSSGETLAYCLAYLERENKRLKKQVDALSLKVSLCYGLLFTSEQRQEIISTITEMKKNETSQVRAEILAEMLASIANKKGEKSQ